MKKHINKYLILLIAFAGIVPGIVFASPGIPHKFYGTVKYTNGSDVTSGNVIVKIGTTQVDTVPISNGKYGYNPDLMLITDPNNNRAGSTLKFFIGSVDTGTTAVFVNGGYAELNLTTVILSDTVYGNGANVSLSSATAGNVGLSTGVTNVVLTNTTVMDLSSGLVSGKVTLQSGVNGSPVVLTNSNLSNISASIPDGTKIQGPAGWDGKITPPISGTPAGGNAPASFSVGSTVISIGSPDGTLVFDKPVIILLAGVTGTVGYRPSGSNTWQTITNVCASPYATPGNPPASSECAISNGTDTKIVTYHFTSFGSLTANPAPTPSGGGGGSSYVPPVVTPTPVVTVVTPAVIAGCDTRTTGFSITTGKSCVGNSATTTTIGKVLGAEKFTFTKVIKNGSKGNEVMELQKFLTALGYNLGTADGKFGMKTKTALIKFQIANKLKGDGVVGPKVRALLNK